MSNPELYSENQTVNPALEVELQRLREREKKLETALHAVFPFDIYIECKPEIKAESKGSIKEILEHYIEYGINEIDIKREGIKRKLGLYKHLEKAASLLAVELKKSKEREKKLESVLQDTFPIDVYKQLKTNDNGIDQTGLKQAIEHFIEHDIKHIDIKKENFKYANSAAQKAAISCLRNLKTEEPQQQSQAPGKRNLALLRTKGNISNLNKNQDHDFAIKHTSIHYKSNSVCTWIPKNGCSNIRYSIAKENGTIASIEEIEWIHRNNDCFNANTKEALQADYTFIILRNPFKRLLSFFLDKLCHTQQDQSEESYQRAHEAFSFNSSLSFTDFIDHIWENSDSIYNDEHTRPQSDFLLYRSYDKYFALEKIKQANQEIHERTRMNLEDIRDKNSIFTSKGCERSPEITHRTEAKEINNLLNLNKIPIVENMYTREMIKKVSTLYLQDILLYCDKVEDSISELGYWINEAISSE